MIAGVLLFLMIISPSIFLVVYCDETFERTIPITLLGITFLMYFAGLMNMLFYGIYVIFMLAIIIYISVIYKCIKYGTKKNISKIFNATFIIFSVFFFTILVANRGIRPHVWDEFTHWVLAVKSMCYHDALFTRSLDEFVSKDYPPGVTLFQYFYSRWVMLCRGTDIFPVGASYAAIQLLQISFIFPLIRKNNTKDPLPIIMTVMMVFLFPLFFYDGIYRNAYVDSTMGILIGTSIATVTLTPAEEKGWSYHILIMLECAFLVLTKRVGLLMAMCLGGSYLLDSLYDIKGNLNVKWKNLVVRIFCTISAIVLPYGIFQSEYKKALAAESISASSEAIANSTPDTALAFGSTKNFFIKFLTLKYDIGYTGIAIPYLLIIVICFLAVFVVYRLYGIYFKDRQPKIAIQGWYCVFVIIAWTGVFYYLMLTSIEDSVLHSFDRYIPPCFIPIAFISAFGVYDLISITDRRKKNILALIAIAFLSLIVPIAEPIKFLNGTYREIADEYYNPLMTLCEKQKDLGLTENDRIYFIAQEDNGFFFNQMRYYAYPTPFASGPWWFSDGKPDYNRSEKNEYSSTIDDKELMGILKEEKVTHVMIFRTDDYFNNAFSSMFDPKAKITDSTIYVFSPTSGLLIEAR